MMTRSSDYTVLRYWGPEASVDYSNPVRHDENFTTAGLLKHADGRCEAWQSFLGDVLKVQGVAATNVSASPGIPSIFVQSSEQTYIIIPPNDPLNRPSRSGILIKSDLGGQGGTPSTRLFNGHALVAVGNSILDPSYGRAYTGQTPQDAHWMWTTASVEAVRYQDSVDPTDLLDCSLVFLGANAIVFSP